MTSEKIIETKKETESGVIVARIGRTERIIIAVITVIGSIVAGYFAHTPNPLAKQGLTKISIEGKWKYICSSFDGTYQHGGRFIVQKQSDGTYALQGERMWKDICDTATKKWTCNTFKESDYLQWHSNWIFVQNDAKIYFEYEIPLQDKNLTGYCAGDLRKDDNIVNAVHGNFYVLNEVPILSGKIYFKRVSDEEYESQSTLPKNH